MTDAHSQTRVVGFRVSPRAHLAGVLEVVPTVDGVSLTDLVHRFERDAAIETRESSYGGLIPSYFRFGPMDQHYLAGETAFRTDRGKVPLLGCDCGEWGCWPLKARIEATPTDVRWDEFEQPHRPQRDYSTFGPFVFSREQYDRALAGLVAALDVGDLA